MIHTIKNFRDLATTSARKDALSIIEAGFAAIDTKKVLKDTLRFDDEQLTVGNQSFKISDYRHIYIIGFGKVSCTAAAVLEDMLAGRVKDGAVIGVKEKVCQVVDTYAGTHPLPSHFNYTATKQVANIAHRATKDDLVLVVVGGGGSALLCSSLAECDQGNRLYQDFLASGGTIDELNTVRKHISTLKGGGLAAALYPATVVGLVFSDIPSGRPDYVASGPTYQDNTTVADAAAVIEKYGLSSYRLVETPKEKRFFERVHNFLLVSSETATAAMAKKATALGYQATAINPPHCPSLAETAELLLEGSAPGVVKCLSCETRLSVPKDSKGSGGRNTHLALYMLGELSKGQVFASVSSDGRDNASAAGAIVDGTVSQKAADKNLKSDVSLDTFDSYNFFANTDDLIETGVLESNVSDLMVLLERKI